MHEFQGPTQQLSFVNRAAEIRSATRLPTMSYKEDSEKSASRTLSATKEECASPQPDILREFLLESSQNNSINSQGSSPRTSDSSEPPTIDQWRQLIKKVCDNLTSNLGLSATDHLRQSIPDGLYWRLEAEHYADQWKKQQIELPPGVELPESSLNMGNLRYLIKDERYWEIEALFYSNYETKVLMSKGFRRISPGPTSRVGDESKALQELGAQREGRSLKSTVTSTRNKRAQIAFKSPTKAGEEAFPLRYELSAPHPSEEAERERTHDENKQRRKHAAESPVMQSHGKR